MERNVQLLYLKPKPKVCYNVTKVYKQRVCNLCVWLRPDAGKLIDFSRLLNWTLISYHVL